MIITVLAVSFGLVSVCTGITEVVSAAIKPVTPSGDVAVQLNVEPGILD